MTVKLLRLCLLLVLFCPSRVRTDTCLTSASSCDECIQSGSNCGWCTIRDADVRCDHWSLMERAGCPKSHIYFPLGDVQVLKNGSSTESANASVASLAQEEFSVRVRPGVIRSFPLFIALPKDRRLSELTLDTSPLPAGVNISFISTVNRNPVQVQVDVQASRCPSETDVSSEMQNRTGPWPVLITLREVSLTAKLHISLACDCECSRNREENSSSCSGRGALVCGRCRCNEPFIGRRCETHISSLYSPDEDACRSGPNAPVCSGRGMCLGDECVCKRRANPTERYTGRFCECNNFDCLYHNNRICGGHGKCECGRCICDVDWTGVDCSCSLETASCLAQNQMLCNGRGACLCGRCKCEPPYAGPTCEVSPFHPGSCEQHRECVECQAFGTGPKKDRCEQECGYLTVTRVATRQDLVPGINAALCKMRSHDDSCIFYFSFDGTSSKGRATVVQAKECPDN